VVEKPTGERGLGPLEDFRRLWRHPAANALFTVMIGISAAVGFIQQRKPISGWDLAVLVPILLGAVLGAAGYAFRGRPFTARVSGASLAMSLTGLGIAVLHQLFTLA
jgi:hypothetical protein